VLAPGEPAAVRLVKPDGRDIGYAVTVLSDDGNHIVVTAPWFDPQERDVGFAIFGPGDVFTEHYWRDRWYSIKEVRASDGALKGWYTDIARPAILENSTIVSEDLDLDRWDSADRRTILRLDEDEFEASRLAERDPQAAAEARRAFDLLADRAAHDWYALLR